MRKENWLWVLVLVVCTVLLSACGDAVKRGKAAADKYSVVAVHGPCTITVGALLRLPDGDRNAVLALCLERN